MKSLRRKPKLNLEEADSEPHKCGHEHVEGVLPSPDDGFLIEFSSSTHAFRYNVAGKHARRLTLPELNALAHAAFKQFSTKEA